MSLDVATLAKPWVEPVSAETPAGANARFDARYEQTVGEVGKLEMPGAGPVNWKTVLETGGDLLKTTSKDLLIASHVSCALYELKGLEGLATGTALLADLLDRYWEGMHPELKRLRGRANALTWYIERVSLGLADRKVNGNDRPAVEAASEAAQRLAGLVRDKFSGEGPALRPLLDAIERIKLSLPEVAPPPPPAPPPPAVAEGSAPSAAPAPSPAPAAAAPVAVQAMPEVTEGADATAVLRELGTAVARTAAQLRARDNAQPGVYRAVRAGVWLPFSAPPPGTGGKTGLPPPPDALKARLEALSASANWKDVLEEAESSFIQFRWWLDLHRLSARALAMLGPGHVAAREALLIEVGSALRRFPTLPNLTFNDGTPFADGATKAWLDEEVIVKGEGGSGGGSSAGADAASEEAEAEAKKLLSGGKPDEAIKVLTEAAARAPAGAARFRARLALAKMCLDAGQAPVARALYEGLDGEIKRHGLDEWDPGLAARCLEGYLLSLRALVKAQRATVSDVAVVYDRLCRLEPAAALRLGA